MTWLAGQMMLAYGWRRALMMFAAGAIAGLSVPPFYILPALFVALPLWVWALDGAERRPGWGRLFGPAFGIGFFAGLGYFLVAIHWVGAAFFVDAGWLVYLMPLAVLLLAAILALFWAFASAVAHLLWSHSAWRLLALSGALAGAEWLRGHLFTGFPFDLLGYALTANLQMMQASSLIGVYGLSFVAALIAMSPALIWPADERGLATRLVPFVAALVTIAAQLGYGQYRLNANPLTARDDMHIRIVQPDISQAQNWRSGARDTILENLISLSRAQANPADSGLEGVTQVIWPETALPFFLSDYPEGLSKLADMLPEGTTLLTGAPRTDPLQGKASPEYNSILALDGDGEVISAYDKVHLVPFGEYLPLSGLFSVFGVHQIVPGTDGWSAGTNPRLMTPQGTPPFVPLICYEAAFPGEMGQHLDEAQFILNITNDSWFDASIGPEQQFDLARQRTLETGLPMIRAANSGVSAVIDPLGRVTARLPDRTVAFLNASVPEPVAPPLYRRVGDGPLGAAILLSLGAAGFRRRLSRRRRGT